MYLSSIDLHILWGNQLMFFVDCFHRLPSPVHARCVLSRCLPLVATAAPPPAGRDRINGRPRTNGTARKWRLSLSMTSLSALRLAHLAQTSAPHRARPTQRTDTRKLTCTASSYTHVFEFVRTKCTFPPDSATIFLSTTVPQSLFVLCTFRGRSRSLPHVRVFSTVCILCVWTQSQSLKLLVDNYFNMIL